MKHSEGTRWWRMRVAAGLVFVLWMVMPGCSATRYERTGEVTAEDTAAMEGVKRAFAADKAYQSVIVTSSQGVVHLSGFVGSESEKQRATEIAARTPGVKNVDNRIHIQ